MPAPLEKEIPDYEYWGFVQKDCNPEKELIPLAQNIVKNNGKIIDDSTKEKILDFLSNNKVKAWSDYWVTIINTLGLAYINPKDSKISSTKLAEYINEGNPLKGFYYYWGLRFQFPFAQNKHKGYKEKGIVVQPVISIMEHLILLFENAIARGRDPFQDAYLTYDEIILVLSKSKTNSILEVKENVNKIYRNRISNYDYSELKVKGYESIYNNFSGRARLYFEKIDLILFDQTNDKIYIKDWNHYFKLLAFLSYRRKAIKLDTTEESRVRLFSNAFNSLEPHPTKLLESVSRINSDYRGKYKLNLVNLLHEKLYSNGIYFEKDFIESFLLSLKTKPFVILSGISGVGKSALPNAIMKIVKNYDCKAIAVSPDWTDNTDMLGYFNVNNEFIIGEFTKLVLDASNNPEIPYFIILDEMNLAKVELYFAQVLSVIESRYFDEELNRVEYDVYLFNNALRSRFLELAEKESDPNKKEYYKKLYNLKLTNNVYIIGTVNIDESTYPFSKKVLDRANVLEINDVDLMVGLDFETKELEESETTNPEEQSLAQIQSDDFVYLNRFFEGKITNLQELKEDWKLNEVLNLSMEESLKKWVELLSKFNNVLKPLKLNFGYRLRDEVCIYLYYAAISNAENLEQNENWWYKYFDQQLLQKVFTRLSGEEGEFETILVDLFNLCSTNQYTQQEILEINIDETEDIIFPKAAKKLQIMLKDLVIYEKPSTSFWSA
ncbi:McrB family protein [Thermaerobacillus caldiproteolyticus]|uniref:McrB family protein n=1 Tax=Thermaerobacillus caldiproteolyticus TaxID=247480 RepID=UPI0018F25A8A|nr:hypothetical protein [Anoxybacillus caldiproteolyticus]